MIREALFEARLKKGKHSSLMFSKMRTFSIPLGAKMMKRILPDNKPKYYFHTLDLDHVNKLIQIQNTKKQVSAFDDWNGVGILSGALDMSKNSPIIAILKGDYSFQGNTDLWTIKDTDGIRWIDGSMIDNVIGDDVMQIFIKIMDEMSVEYSKLYPNFTNQMISTAPFDGPPFPEESLHKMIKDYFDVAEKVMLKHVKELKKASLPSEDDSPYNEVIGYNFKIEGFIVVKNNFVDERFLRSKGIKFPYWIVKDSYEAEKILLTYKRKNK